VGVVGIWALGDAAWKPPPPWVTGVEPRAHDEMLATVLLAMSFALLSHVAIALVAALSDMSNRQRATLCVLLGLYHALIVVDILQQWVRYQHHQRFSHLIWRADSSISRVQSHWDWVEALVAHGVMLVLFVVALLSLASSRRESQQVPTKKKTT